MAPLNDSNATCNRCHKPTVPLFQNGLKRWCPDCERDKPKDRDLPRIGSDRDRDEVTNKDKTIPMDPWGWQKFQGKI